MAGNLLFEGGVRMEDALRPAVTAYGRSRGISRVLIVANPASRSASRAIRPAIAAAERAGVAYDLVTTACAGDATRVVRRHLSANDHGYDAVLSIGGDGTAMEVAAALAEIPEAPPLGIIASGTANVLARTLGISLRADAAVDSFLDADVADIDLGRVTGGPVFVIGLGVGLDAAMIGGASPQMKARMGYLAYALAALRSGLRLERFNARIMVDGVVHECRTSSVLVANFGSVLGDLLCFNEGTGPQDGLLDVCIYSPRTVLDAARILLRMIVGGVCADRCVRVIRGRHIRIECDAPRTAQADGELVGSTPLEVHVAPRALHLLVPRSARRRSPLPAAGHDSSRTARSGEITMKSP